MSTAPTPGPDASTLDKYDKDHDGKIDDKDFKQMSSKEFQSYVLEKYDKDHDGKLTKKDFELMTPEDKQAMVKDTKEMQEAGKLDPQNPAPAAAPAT